MFNVSQLLCLLWTFFWRHWQHIVLGPGPMFTIHYSNYIPKYKILDRYSTLYKIHSEVWVKTKSLFGKVQSESEVELWCLMFWLVHIHNFWQKYYVVKDKYIGFKFWGKAELGKSLESPNPKLKNQVRSSPPPRDQSQPELNQRDFWLVRPKTTPSYWLVGKRQVSAALVWRASLHS